MINNTIKTDVAVPPDIAYAFLTECRRWPEWMESVRAVIFEGTFAAGVEVTVEYTEGVQAKLRIETADPPSGYSYTVDSKDMSIVGTMRLENIGGSTRLTYEESVTPRSFVIKMMKPFIANGIKRALAKDFASAKSLMEEER